MSHKNLHTDSTLKNSNSRLSFLNRIASLIPVLMVLFCSDMAMAQGEDWVWAQNAGGIFNEARGERVVTDNSGHVIVVGTYSCPQLTFGTITINNSGGDDLFIVKMDTGGNVLWAQTAGGDYAEEGYAVAVDDAGNVYVSGEFWSSSVSFGTNIITNSGSADIFIAKYDASGNSLWAKSVTGTDEDHGNAVAVDLAGNVIITGSYLSTTLDFGGISLTNSQPGTEDLFIAKYDGNGNILWARQASGTGNDKGFGVGTDAAGNVLVSGHFNSGSLNFGTQTLFNSGGFDIFLVKYDENGNLLWAKNPSGSGYDFNFSMETDADGNAYVTGYFSSFQLTFGSVTITNTGGDDIYVVKYDASGTALWAQKAGGVTYDYSYDVSVDNEGSVFLTGNFQSPTSTFGTITLTNTTTYADFYVVKYNAAGEVQWAKNGESSDYAFGRGCGAGSDGNVYVTGLFGNSTLTLGSLTLTTVAGATDMFIARYGNANCNNVYYADADNDSYGNAAITVTACSAPAGFVSDSTDCNDADPSVFAPTTWFLDADADGYGLPEINLITACSQPAGYVSDNTDCNDEDAAINPGATEIPNNGIDDDCDGLVDEIATGINMVEDVASVLNIFPNPTQGSFFIQLDLTDYEIGTATIEVSNIEGKKMYTEKMQVINGQWFEEGFMVNKEINLNRSIADGMYLIKVLLNDKILTGLVICQH